MQECFQQYPELYADYDESEVVEEGKKEGEEEVGKREKEGTVMTAEQAKISADSGSKLLTSSSAS